MSLLTRIVGVFVLLGLTVAAPDVAGAQEGAPHLAIDYQVSPEQVTSLFDELTVEIAVSGRGGRVGDLPLEVRDRLPRRPLEVVLVVDRSGSMENDDYHPTRLEAAKRAAEVFLQQIQPGDSAALVSFEKYVTLDAPLTEDRELSLEALWHLRPDGGTAIGEGVHRAIQVLHEGASESVKAIVLLSDGASNEGRDPIRAANEARDAGIPVFTVGIGAPGDEFDEFTLRSIAETTGGEYLYAPDASELGRVYERMGGKVINVAGVNASLEIEVTGLLALDEYTTDGLEVSGNTRLLYRYDQIPVGEAKTIHLLGRPTVLLPGERAAVIEAVRLTYQSLGSERERVVTAGPVEVEFEDAVLDRDANIEIDEIRFRRTEEEYGDSPVYTVRDDVRADIELNRRPRRDVTSYASVVSSSGAVEFSREVSDDDTVSHRLDHPGHVGRQTLFGLVGDERLGATYDSAEEDFYVVFRPPSSISQFSLFPFVFGKTVVADPNFRKGKLFWTLLHPRHPRILDAAADLLDMSDIGSTDNQREAAHILARKLADNLVVYSVEDRFPANLYPEDNNHISDLDVLDAGLGDCTDMGALYVSMVRSLNIPVRGVVTFYRTGNNRRSGHFFAEVYVDGEWVHADPTWRSFDDSDIYIRDGHKTIIALREHLPGLALPDGRTTLKYAVGLLSPGPDDVFVHDLNDGAEFEISLHFVNRAEEVDAGGFTISVVDSGGLDIEPVTLDGDDNLEAGEEDTAELEVRIPDTLMRTESLSMDMKEIPITLEVEYEDDDSDKIVKRYRLNIRLYRFQ